MLNPIQYINEFLELKRNKAFVDKQYLKFCHKKMNWKNPKTYNEKIQIYKLSKEMENLWRYADKCAVRKIVEKKVGPSILNKVYGVWKDVLEIDFKKLPKQFILKANHGSGWYIIVKNKNKIDESDVRHRLYYWLNINYYEWYGKERQYKLIKPRIICERYLEDRHGNLPDYKFFCFDGKVHFIQITVDRIINHRRKFYDRDWKVLPFSYGPHPYSKKSYPRPKNFSGMIEIAEKLSSGLRHARIDLYDVNGKIYFGEITLTPGNGMDLFHPAKYDKIYGKIFRL